MVGLALVHIRVTVGIELDNVAEVCNLARVSFPALALDNRRELLDFFTQSRVWVKQGPLVHIHDLRFGI